MNHYKTPCVVTIAGTDPSGGAGIQADIKAISATGSYAASIITALVAQNTQGVQAIQEVSAEFVKKQFDSVFTDLDVHAIKIGMLHDARIIDVVFSELKKLKIKHVVFDPVMVAKGGSVLLDLDTISLLKQRLVGAVSLITPNLFEAEHILGRPISTVSEMSIAATELGKSLHLDVLIKGGHLIGNESSDVLYVNESNQHHWFHAQRIQTKNTHGTGCTLSSAIASYLGQGYSQPEAISKAKSYLTKAIESGIHYSVGHGFGPVDHFYFLDNREH